MCEKTAIAEFYAFRVPARIEQEYVTKKAPVNVEVEAEDESKHILDPPPTSNIFPPTLVLSLREPSIGHS